MSKTSKQYVLVLSGNLTTLMSGFLISVLATHTMATSEYGFYKAYLIALQLFATISHLGFHYTFGREYAASKSISDLKSLNGLGLKIIFICSFTLLLGFYLLFFTGEQFEIFSIPEYIKLASWTVSVMLLIFFAQQKLQGKNEMGYYAALTILPQLFMSILFSASYLLGISLSGEQVVFSYLIFNVISLMFIFKEGVKFNTQSLNKKIIQNNKTYGFNLYLGSLVAVSASQFLSLLIATIAGLEEYGLFALGMSLASPIAYVASTLGIVNFKRNLKATHINNNELIRTAMLTFGTCVLYYIFLNFFIEYIIGVNYRGAVKYANVLIIFYAMTGLGDYLNKFLSAKGEGTKIRNGSILSGVSLVSISALLIPFLGIAGLIVSKIIGALVYLISMTIAYKKTIKELGK
ncbi:lipopolysaccharide biosynthesis protein [Exiguobacterium alkaliphilum]|uniref:lipopolysaccharide biosynthesis protein n=1 Tax=Exiguobacterium alkaliphilum TaxID=1428684 RepID=UPI001FEB9804|nr:oligosaccharide flippase family protein [Exiguobacterium alkaliphilum]